MLGTLITVWATMFWLDGVGDWGWPRVSMGVLYDAMSLEYLGVSTEYLGWSEHVVPWMG